jgi:CheY-like chemotaxis protein
MSPWPRSSFTLRAAGLLAAGLERWFLPFGQQIFFSLSTILKPRPYSNVKTEVRCCIPVSLVRGFSPRAELGVSDVSPLERENLSVERESGKGEAIAVLAGGLAHELNNLLSATLMMVDLLSEGRCAEADRPLLTAVGESSRRGVGLVRQLLWLARGGEQESRFQVLYVLTDLLRMAQATFPPAVAVSGDLASDLWMLAGDPSRVYRLLLSLCGEAKARLAGGGRLTLSARNERLDEVAAAQRPGLAAGPYVRIEVGTDRGGGDLAAPEALRLLPAGGFVETRGLPEGGRVFRLFLPAFEAVPDEAGAPVAADASGEGRLVLVAEGHPAVRQAMAAVLERGSFRVLAAADGAEAVALFARDPGAVAAVVVGTGLAFLDPPAVVRAVRRLREGVAALATGGAEELAAWPELALQARLTKPFTGPQLLAAVRRAVEGGIGP